MKRISILSALLLMCAMTFAQQALWGGAPVVSPEIHDNNTVTFRLKAPKAVKVQVTGDFLPTQKIKTPFGEFDGPGVADLKENKDGVWEFTTPEPLKPELYSYTFLVDGLKINDPANVYMIRDVASVTNVFIIGGDERIDLYKVNKVPHGTVSKVWSIRLPDMRQAASATPSSTCYTAWVATRTHGANWDVRHRFWITSSPKARPSR